MFFFYSMLISCWDNYRQTIANMVMKEERIDEDVPRISNCASGCQIPQSETLNAKFQKKRAKQPLQVY